ncbi:MAG TPA: hypothetical protein VNA25_21275 [Phycisphaerae bacterium]|nr:hypothetical protein [Phycisphaerae bacterium]
MLSIDQNCHSLWDALPKLQALAGRRLHVRHLLEDIDVAFTQVGASVGSPLRLARERYYRGGAADWGAAMFYHQFLGRLPVDVHDWEPYTGLTTKALANQLGVSVDDLYDEFSPSDNWQLIGPSYVGDREHHRLIGDLSVAETGEFLRELLSKARQDMTSVFPDEPSRKRLAEWLDREEAQVQQWLADHAARQLVDLYRRWLGEHLGAAVEIDSTSRFFALGADADREALLEIFLRDYDLAAGLYNQALAEGSPTLHPLRTADGELPFFAALRRDGHLVRTGVFRSGDALRIGRNAFALAPDRRLPGDALRQAGVIALAGKAVLLTIQARVGAGSGPLVLPHRGSYYMPATHLLARKLQQAGLLGGDLHPVMRIRFRLLDRIRSLSTTIRPPPHLARALGRDELPAGKLGECWADLAREATSRLEAIADPAGRQAWQRRNMPRLFDQIDELDRRRRQLAAKNPKAPDIRDLWKRTKPLQTELLRRTVQRIADDWQLRDVDYWDSRGALLPVCIALGGREFYDSLLAQAEVYEEAT